MNVVFTFFNFILVLDDDDVAVLDLVSKHEGDLSRPRPLTGSAAREPAMEEYSLDSKQENFNSINLIYSVED